MPSKGNPPLSARAPEDVHRRVEAAAERARCSKSEWILEAVLMALETDEAPHVPKAVRDATPKRVGTMMRLPSGRTWERR